MTLNTGIIIDPYQPYMVSVSGRVSVASNPAAACSRPAPYGAEGSYGPGGTGGGWGSFLVSARGLRVDGGGVGGASLATSDTLEGYSYATEVTASRSALYYEVGGGSCPPTGFYLLSGSQTLTVTLLDGVELTLDPKVAFVRRGTPVTFTARSRGALASVAIWKFTKSDSLPNQTAACSTNPCTFAAMNSGTLRAIARLYGKWRSDASAIRVYSSFALQADRTSVNYGDSVTFTPMIDGVAGKADRWRWAPDSVTAGATACADGTGPCKTPVTASGVMWAYAGQDSERVHVTVLPCPTNDPLLDQVNIRQDFMRMMNLSNPDSAPGTGMDSTHSHGVKSEQGRWIYKRDDGSYFSIPMAGGATSDECSIGVSPLGIQDTLGGHLVAAAHSHPGDDLKPVYGKCVVLDQGEKKPTKRYPGDESGVQGFKGKDATYGGGSGHDWDITRLGLDVYIMNKQGEVWRLPAYTDADHHLQDLGNRVKKWRGNSNPSCNW